MNAYQNELKENVSNVLGAIENKEWQSLFIVVEFPPTENKGFTMTQKYFDSNGEKMSLFAKPTQSFKKVINDYFLDEIKATRQVNQINIDVKNEKPLAIQVECIFNQDIVNRFEENLPKSQRGKTKAWYTTDLG